MRIDQTDHGAVRILRIAGPLSGDEARGLPVRVGEAVTETLGRVVVDLSGAPYADSIGLEALADAGDRLERGGMSLKLAGTGETMREAMELTGLSRRFEMFDAVEDAVRSFL